MRYGIPPSSRSGGKKIAVIGTGVAGLSAAWLLSQRHQVTVYEKDSWIGGHAHTVDVETPRGTIPVDTGFIVYNELNYPNLTALFKHLGVATERSSMSFAASVDCGRFEYSSDGLNRYCGQRRNILRPRFWRMTADLLRFYRIARRIDPEGPVDDITIGAYLEREGYSTTFVEDHILPMSAAIWSTTPDEIRAYPLRAFIRFYSSHGLFEIGLRRPWMTVTGGSREYVNRIAKSFSDVRLNTGVRRILRDPGGVTVEDTTGHLERYSDVVVAAHADEALKLLGDSDAAEQRILGSFGYTNNEAVLHTDEALMPRQKRVWSSWNFIGNPDPTGSRQLSVSYWMNKLQNLDRRSPLFLSLNPRSEPRPDSVIGSYSYSHPYFDRAALAAQDELWRLQGSRRTWFCGAYFGYGFHEDGVQSGLAVAEALGGVKRPWVLPAGSERIAPAYRPEPVEVAA